MGKRFLSRLVLSCALAAPAIAAKAQDNTEKFLMRYVFEGQSAADKSGKFPAGELKDGAKVEASDKGGFLSLDGKKGYLSIPKSEEVRLTTKGFAMCAVVKFSDDGKAAGKPEAHDMIFFKNKEFLLGRDLGELYFNFHDGKNWSGTLKGGALPAGVWTHVAASVERVDDVAQGEVGYKVALYVNGVPTAQKKFLNVTPATGTEPVTIGKGWGGPWLLNGGIAEASIYDFNLTEGDVEKLAYSTPFVTVSKRGFARVDAKLREKLEAIKKASGDKMTVWAADCLGKAATFGFDTAELLAAADRLGAGPMTAGKLAKAVAPFKVIDTGDLAVMFVDGRKISNPLLGVYSKKTGADIFAEAPLSLGVTYSKNGAKEESVDNLDSCVEARIVESGSDFLKIEWLGRGGAKGIDFKAASKVRFAGPRVEMDLKFENLSPDVFAREVVFPKMQFAKLKDGADKLVHPYMCGVLVDNPTTQRFWICQEGMYPSGRVTLPFGAYYDSKAGVYFGYEDPNARTKFYSVSGKKTLLEVLWKNYPGLDIGAKGGNGFEMSGRAVVEVFGGDWFDAGQVYKRWMTTECPPWWTKELPRKDTPEWFRNLPLWVLMFSNSSAMDQQREKTLADFRKYLELPYGVHWYSWEDMKKADNMPHALPREGVPDMIKRIEAGGVHVKPYIDSRLFALLDGENREKDWMFTSHGKAMAAKAQNGDMYYEDYDKWRYAIMCPASKAWQDWLVNMTGRVAGYGATSIYHDQVATAAARMCFDKSHGHKLGGGDVWLEEGYWKIFDRINKEVKTKHPELAQDTEENADVYAKAFDGFMVWRWTEDTQIPLFTSIFAGRAQFTGRLFDHQSPGSQESFMIKCAEQLVYAEQIGWFSLGDMFVPGLKKLFAKKMAHLRVALLEWFNEGDMIHPLKFKEPVPTVTEKWGAVGSARTVTTPKVFHSVWKRGDGSVMIVFVNAVKDSVKVSPILDGAAFGFGGGDIKLGVCREGFKPVTATVKSGSEFPVELKPFASEVWFLLPDDSKGVFGGLFGDDSGKAFSARLEKTSAVLERMSKFTAGDYPEFKDTARRPFGSWLTYKEQAGLFGVSVEAKKERFWQIQTDGLIYFGVVDLGEKGAKRKLEAELAVHPSFAGNKVEFFADAPDGMKGTLVARLDNLESTGGFDKYGTFSAKVSDNVGGPRKLFARFGGTACCNMKKCGVFMSE